MAKDPAFLFYSKDFYEGTRMMLPEERACYIDLMIYQHQNGIIPNDTRRLMMYCSGCSHETIVSVLNQKFNQTENGWSNQKLNHLVDERSKYKPKKIASATLAGLISASKLNKKQKEKVKKSFRIDDFIQKEGKSIIDETIIKSSVREWFNQLVNQMVNNLVNVNAIVNEDVIKDENGEAVLYPSFDDFWNEYDKKVGSKAKIKKKWNKLSQSTKEAIMLYLPKYKASQPNKKFRKNPETFLNNESWKDELINYDNGNTTNEKSDSQIRSDINNAVDELLG